MAMLISLIHIYSGFHLPISPPTHTHTNFKEIDILISHISTLAYVGPPRDTDTPWAK